MESSTTTQLSPHKRPIRARKKNLVGIRWFVLTIFFIFYLLIFLPLAENVSLVILTLLPTSLSLWFGPLTLIRSDNKRKIYDPATLFNSSLFYYSLKGVTFAWGVKPKFLNTLQHDAIIDAYPLVVFYTCLGIIIWNLGYYLATKNQDHLKTQSNPNPSKPTKNQLSSKLSPRLGVGVLTIIGFACLYLLLWSINEDIFVFVRSSWKRGYLADQTVFGTGSAFANFFMFGIYMLPVASIVWLAITGAKKQYPLLGWWIYTILVFSIVFILASRAFFLGYVVSLLIVFHLTIKPIRASVLMVVGTVGVVYAYMTHLWRRVSGAQQAFNIQTSISAVYEQLNLRGFVDFIGSEALADIRIFVLVTEYYGKLLPLKYGETLLRIFYQFIPRALWTNKPYDLGVELGRLANPNTFSGTPPGFFAEMYMNFHILGVLFGSFLFGLLAGFLYRKWILAHNNNNLGILGIVLYAFLAQRLLLIPSNTFSLAILAIITPMIWALAAFKLCEIDANSHKSSRKSSRKTS